MPSEYISLGEFKASAELYGFSFADLDARAAIAAAARGIDEYCGRRFYLDADATSVRYYSPTNPGYIEIDDLVTLGTVKTDTDGDSVYETTWVQNRDYYLEPLNAPADFRPYERVCISPYGGQRWPYWGGPSVSVQGRFGWPECPAPVKEATTILATRYLKRAREAPFGIVQFGVDASTARISRADPDVAWLLDPYVRGQGVMIA